eukprot:9457503-Prorocentrum_lima.AAC.1
MTSSLVGSEMCIRDRYTPVCSPPKVATQSAARAIAGLFCTVLNKMSRYWECTPFPGETSRCCLLIVVMSRSSQLCTLLELPYDSSLMRLNCAVGSRKPYIRLAPELIKRSFVVPLLHQ